MKEVGNQHFPRSYHGQITRYIELLGVSSTNSVSAITETLHDQLDLALTSLALHRPKSSLGLRTEQDLASSPLAIIPFGSMTRGKSLPSIHIDITAQGDPVARDEQERLRAQVALQRERHNSSMEHLQRPSAAPPTITVTEHSPVSSIQFFINQVSLGKDH